MGRRRPKTDDPSASGGEATLPPARDVVLRLLSVRGLTRFELRQRLATRGYGEAEIGSALASLEAGGWLPPDTEMVRAWADGRVRRGTGKSRLVREIARRGIGSEEAERLAAGLLGEEGEEAALRRELERLLRTVKKSPTPRPRGAEGRRGPSEGARRAGRIFERLLRRGFAPAAIRRALGAAGLFDGGPGGADATDENEIDE